MNHYATAVGGNPVHFFRTIVGNFVRRCDNLTVECVYDNSLNGNFGVLLGPDVDVSLLVGTVGLFAAIGKHGFHLLVGGGKGLAGVQFVKTFVACGTNDDAARTNQVGKREIGVGASVVRTHV